MSHTHKIDLSPRAVASACPLAPPATGRTPALLADEAGEDANPARIDWAAVGRRWIAQAHHERLLDRMELDA